MSDEAKALHGLLEFILNPCASKKGNLYTKAPVVTALKALAKATGHSTFGYDYLDILDKLEAKPCT